MSDAPFQVGDEVRLLDNPTKTGTVLSVSRDPQFGEWMARVRVDGRVRMLMAEDLELAGPVPSDPWDDIANGVLAPARDLRTLLTYERLRRPPGPIGRAFGTARARLYPFQFKPLVKFLENPLHTLLIADEVGLGKTIEAGYILREWKERQTIDTVMIVVPARLRTKWKGELESRFDERFDIVSAREVRAMLKKVRQGRELEPFQWVASYESLRRPDIVEALAEASPPIDMVILDEAHRVRNRATHQHRLARALAASAQAMLFLTATPVQTSLDNLHTLLDLLQPDSFGTAENFQSLVEANRPVMRAATLAAGGAFVEAASQLQLLERHRLTASLYKESVVQQLIEDLEAGRQATRRRRVALQAAIADLSLTGHLLTRTRKTEVFENRARRTAQPVFVDLSEEELEIYRIVEHVTRLLHPDAGAWGRSMAALTAYRYTASCIPAAVSYMRSRLTDAGFVVGAEGLEDELDMEVLEDEWDGAVGEARAEDVERRIARAFALCPSPGQDRKLRELIRALRSVWGDDRRAGRPRRKMIIFSFFKRTIAYLHEQLGRAGFTNTVIHGDIPMDEREERIEAFLTQEGLDVLVSSEVGGEGLDLQAASVVVNYDLPWNPMVVEQRIGRVDRIGQESDRIVILNLVCSDTVEDRILHRLYQRVNLFEASIGEMEEILGSAEVRELIVALLRGELTAAELETRVEQTAQAAMRRRQDAEALADRVDGLLAADQAILDQIRGLVEGHRLPSERDVADLVRGFLESTFPGVRIHGDPTRQVADLDLPPDARASFEQWSDRVGGARHLVGAFRRGPVRFTVSADEAMRRGRVEFVQARHPLVQFAVDMMSHRATLEGASFGARLETDELPSGHWLVGVWSIAMLGGERRTEIGCAASRIGHDDTVAGDDAEPLLRRLLDDFEELDPRPCLDADVVREAADRVQDAFMAHVVRTDREGKALTERRQARRRATWVATLRQQVERAWEHLQRMRERDAAPFAIRMAEAKHRKRSNELERVTQEFEHAPSFRLEPTEVATILVEVVR